MLSINLVFCALAIGADAAPEAPNPGAAVAKGLAFLEKEAEHWKEEHQCASCHHVPMAIWALHEAKRAGYSVDEELLGKWTAWVLTDAQARVLPDPANKNPNYNGLEMGGVYAALALSAIPAWDDRTRDAWNRVAAHVVGKQTPDGSFPGGTGRPPILERPETTTALAALVLSPPAGESAKLRDVAAERSKALRWLAETKTGGDHQALVMRLLLATGPGAPADGSKGLIDELLKRQNGDGGWSQTPEMASDALATGQSLYALAAAGLAMAIGDVVVADGAIGRGAAFLARTQSPDGSWPMTSRPVHDQPKGAPSKLLTPITAAGAAWGTMGLARAVPRHRIARL